MLWIVLFFVPLLIPIIVWYVVRRPTSALRQSLLIATRVVFMLMLGQYVIFYLSTKSVSWGAALLFPGLVLVLWLIPLVLIPAITTIIKLIHYGLCYRAEKLETIFSGDWSTKIFRRINCVTITFAVVILALIFDSLQIPKKRWFNFNSQNMYVQVIDQNNRPVTDATIEYSLSRGFEDSIKTDTKGLTKIVVADNCVRIKLIWHDNYHIDFYPQLGRYPSNDFMHGFCPSGFKSWNATNPLVIKAWAYTLPEDVDPTTAGQYPKFDTGYRKLYFHRKSSGKFNIPFDLRVSIQTQGEVKKIILEMDGGLLQTQDLYMYQAPETGYTQSWSTDVIKKSLDAKCWKFYVKTANGSYGKIFLDGRYLLRDRKPHLSLRYTINYRGTANLNAYPHLAGRGFISKRRRNYPDTRKAVMNGYSISYPSCH